MAMVKRQPRPSAERSLLLRSDDPKVREIEALLDERIRPFIASDGGWLEILELEDSTLKIRYEGACGSCPSSLTGTLMAIRLYISLKNLIHSVANTGVTYKEIENYAAWGNAQTYYSAISEIWGHPPTFQELNFSPATLDLHALEEMFERMVKNDAP